MEAALVPTGKIVLTRTAWAELAWPDVAAALKRHVHGDWGDLDEDDKAQNDRSLQRGCRLLSAYRDAQGTVFWIITEADRSVTTVMLPEEY